MVRGPLEPERHEEGEEPDPGAQRRDRGSGQHDPRPLDRVARCPVGGIGRLGLGGAVAGGGRARDPHGRERRREEQDAGQPEHPRRAEKRQLQHRGTGAGDDEPGDDRDDCEPRVRFDQLALRVDNGRDERALRDGVGLREHQHAERLGIEPDRARQVPRHGEADERPPQRGADDHRAPAGAAAVEDRAQHGRHDRERRHRQGEVEGDLRLGLGRVDREEE